MIYHASHRWNCLKFFLLLSLCHLSVYAQVVTKQKTVTKQSFTSVTGYTKEITFDISGRAFSDFLPFDVPFILSGTKGINDKITIDKIISIECFYKERGKTNDEKFPKDSIEQAKYRNWQDGRMYANWYNNGADVKWKLSIKELRPNKDFSFFFKFNRKLSDDERAKLVSLATKIVPPLIMQKVNGSFVPPSIVDMEEIIQATVRELSVKMKESNQEINTAAFSKIDNKAVSSAIEELAFAFEGRLLEQQSLAYNIEALVADTTNLGKFLVSYKASQAKKTENVVAINNALRLLKLILSYPKGANAVNPEIAKAYLAQIENFKAELSKVTLPDPTFENLKKVLMDHVGDLATNFNGYSDSIISASETTNTEVNNFVNAVINYIEDRAVISATTTNNNFVTRSNSFITADIGVALLSKIGKMVPYLGTNIYLRPINQDRPLFFRDLFTLKDFDRRFSLMLGLTYSSLAKANYRDNLMATFNLITGGGLRIADFVKVNGGVVWYTRVNPNLLSSNHSIGGSGFVSLSFDLQIKTVFHKLFAADVTTIPAKP